MPFPTYCAPQADLAGHLRICRLFRAVRRRVCVCDEHGYRMLEGGSQAQWSSPARMGLLAFCVEEDWGEDYGRS